MNLLGQCCGGCAGGQGGYQYVCAVQAWPIGSLPFDPTKTDGTQIGLSDFPVIRVPRIGYRTLTWNIQIAGLNISWGFKWDLYNNNSPFGADPMDGSPTAINIPNPTPSTTPGEYGPSDIYLVLPFAVSNENLTVTAQCRTRFASGGPDYYGTCTGNLSDPITYEDAVGMALARLAAVKLLDPLAVYELFDPNLGTTSPANFGYGYQQHGSLGIINTITVLQNGTLQQSWYTDDDDFPEQSISNGYTIPVAGGIFVKKLAWFNTLTYNQKYTITQVPGTGVYGPYYFTWGGQVDQPVNLGPGELVFDPTDVPGYGYTWYLPAPGQ